MAAVMKMIVSLTGGGPMLFLLLFEAKIVDPELTTDRTAHRNATDVQNYELAVRVGREFSSDRLPVSRLFHVVTVVINRLRGVHVLYGEVRPPGAYEVRAFVVGGKLIGCVGLYRDVLEDAAAVAGVAVSKGSCKPGGEVRLSGPRLAEVDRCGLI